MGKFGLPTFEHPLARWLARIPMTSLLYEHVLSPFYERLTHALWSPRVHPNIITSLGGCCCAASLAAMDRGCWGWAFLCFTAYHMLDNMDGKHARRTHQTSRLGKVLDHAVD